MSNLRTNFTIAATNGTYLSDPFNVNDTGEYVYYLTFEFYDDVSLTTPSTGVTGNITVNGKSSENAGWSNIPDSMVPSVIDASNPLNPTGFQGILYQLQIITSSLTNTNYVNIILDQQKSSKTR